MKKNPNMPLVTVVMTTYRNYRYVLEALESVIAQDYPNIEIIIADDGSPEWENNRNIIHEYIETRKSENIINVKLMGSSYNQGTVKNLNRALREASGEYIKPVGSDDIIFDSTVLKNMVSYLVDHDVSLVCGKVEKISRNGESLRIILPTSRQIKKLNSYTSSKLNMKLMNECIIPSTGIMYKRELMGRHGYYDEDYKYIEDHPFWLRLTRSGEKILFIEDLVMKYRVGGISNKRSKALNDAMKKDYLNMIFKEIAPYDLSRLSHIKNTLRVRRADFVFEYSEYRYQSIRLLVLCISKFDAFIYYLCKACLNHINRRVCYMSEHMIR